MPASCKVCGKVEPSDGTLEILTVMQEFPGLVRPAPRGACLDYSAARWLAEIMDIADALHFVRMLETAIKGLYHVK